jgi:23S rRNA (pseudouridine1915-N3)-methyltransferase
MIVTLIVIFVNNITQGAKFLPEIMKVVLLQTGKTTDKYISEGVEEYSSRIRKYTGFEIITIPEMKNTGNMPAATRKILEAKSILQALGKDDYVVILDEKGKELSTKEFAAWMEKVFLMSKKRVVFIIGGPWGFAKEINERAAFKLSLSKLTFSHQLVRLLFAEQLYRIMTVIHGNPYHHE